MSVLFTTGATVTFQPLVEYVVSPSFLLHLSDLGFEHIAIQYGNQIENGRNLSKQFFSDALNKHEVVEKLDLDLTNVTNDKTVTTFANKSFTLLAFAFSPDISNYIADADIVVSHAGTGSILDSLRLHKPLLVVTNLKLMDNHQEEVASQFEKEGYLYKLSTEDVAAGKLEEYLGAFKKGKLKFSRLPDPPTGVVESIISEEALQT
ncbi:CIC11C00000000171 [Sungouiella intermedia]|uniref:UDP-N-acetylglucosamine transferase subunit ALG13 n=1 Tax=Sungouiella intermedia TaxID=45354 RepID=A0A1L0BN42_9ASCO|nr:CIC11C00000000171 [[Candida] intermedia]